MSDGFETFQKFGKNNVDFALRSAEAVTKGLQTIAAETNEYSRRSFDASASAFQKLTAAKTLNNAVAVQSDFARAAYEDYVGQMFRFSEIVADMAKDVSTPYQAFFQANGKSR